MVKFNFGNPSETLLVKLGPMLKKLGRNPKV